MHCGINIYDIDFLKRYHKFNLFCCFFFQLSIRRFKSDIHLWFSWEWNIREFFFLFDFEGHKILPQAK